MPYVLRALVVVALASGCGDDTPGGQELDAAAEPDAGEIDAPDLDAGEIDAVVIDATPIDVPPAQALPFDVAYADAWTFRGVVGAMTQSVGLVINPITNAEALDLSTLRVVSVVDDHPVATTRVFVNTPAAALLPVGSAAGNLSTAAAAHVDPLVTETVADPNAPVLAFEFGDLPQPVNAVINVTAVLRNGSEQVTLTFVLTLRTSGIGATVTSARRDSSAPVP